MATITLIASIMGKRVVTIYVGSIAVMSIINGYVLNAVFKVTGAPLPVIENVHRGHVHGAPHSVLPALFAAAFAIILAASFYRRARETIMPSIVRMFSRAVPAADVEHTLVIGGMTCTKCRNKVAAALKMVPGVSSVQVDLVSHTAKVQSPAQVERLVKAVEDAGYTARNKP